REPGLYALFARPWVTAAAKRNIAIEIATRLQVSKLARDFLALVAAQGRADHLEAIAAAYRELHDEAEGRVRARVRTAVPLSDADRSALTGRLSHVLGGKQVILEEIADRELLGGFGAEVGSLLVDASLDGQLARMHRRLAQGQGGQEESMIKAGEISENNKGQLPSYEAEVDVHKAGIHTHSV